MMALGVQSSMRTASSLAAKPPKQQEHNSPHRQQWLFHLGLGLLIAGNGFFKPNISTIVGALYTDNDPRKDSAFTIFYMGINIGALLSQFLCPMIGDVKIGGVQDVYAFKWGFLAAGVAMILGTVLFAVLKNKYVVTPDGKPLGGVPSKSDVLDSEGEEI